jgi:hypothetical protein
MNCRAAFIGPTVWELEGPMPILKISKTEFMDLKFTGAVRMEQSEAMGNGRILVVWTPVQAKRKLHFGVLWGVMEFCRNA